MRTRAQIFRSLLAVIAGLVAATVPAAAATCSVPSAPHPTIQAAIDDIGCDPIVVAAGTYVEAPVIARSVSVQGAGSGQSSVQGRVEIQAGTVSLTGLSISAADNALLAHSGAEMSGFDLEVVNGFVETPLFADGFEDGTTGSWAVTSP